MQDIEFKKIMYIILKASIFIFILDFLSKFLGYLFNVMLVKSLPVEVIGVYMLAWTVVISSSEVLLLGIPLAVYRHVAFYRGCEDKKNVNATIKTGSIILLGLVLSSLIIFLLIFTFFPEFLSLNIIEYILVSILFITNSFLVFFSSIISGFRKPQISSLIQFAAQVLKVLFIFVVVLIGANLINVLLALYLAFFIPTVMAMIYVIKNFGWGDNFNLNIGKKLIKFGIPATITNISNTLLAWTDMFMIRIFLGFSDLGIYSIVNLTTRVGFIFFYPVIEIFSPMITEFFGEKNKKKVGYISSYLFETMFIPVLPLFILFIVFPSEILTIFFKEEYTPGAFAFQLMSVSMLLYGISQLFIRILSASGNPQKEAKIVVFAALVNVLSNLILISRFGISGAAFSTVVSSTIILISSYFYARRIVQIEISKSRISKLILSALIGFSIVFLVKKFVSDIFLSLFASVVFLVPVYLILLILLKTFRTEDIILLKAVMIKVNIPEGLRNGILNIFQKGIP